MGFTFGGSLPTIFCTCSFFFFTATFVSLSKAQNSVLSLKLRLCFSMSSTSVSCLRWVVFISFYCILLYIVSILQNTCISLPIFLRFKLISQIKFTKFVYYKIASFLFLAEKFGFKFMFIYKDL